MFQAAYYDRTSYTYYIRDDKRGWIDFKYTPELYRIHPEGNLSTLDGKRAFATDRYDWKDNSLYEKDVDKLTRVLIDLYQDNDDIPEYHNVIYFDIECEIGGALTPEYIRSAPMKMTSVSVYDQTTKKYYCYILDEKKQLKSIETENKIVIPFDNEGDMLSGFLDLWQEIDPTIITGWNSGFFDVPYMYYRIKKVLGQADAERLSPLLKINITEWNVSQPIELGGINHLDYMLLFKKYVTKQEPSYKLGDIGEKYVNLGKISYEGNLDRLFKDDINKFIEYNLRDVEIIIELENKLKFIDLTVILCHLCHVPYEQIYLSTVLNDGAILTYLKRKGIVSPNKPTTINPSLKPSSFSVDDEVKSKSGTGKKWTGYIKALLNGGLADVYIHETGETKQVSLFNVVKNEEYAGGYLKEPIPGLYEWIIDLDFTSLYPSIIRSLNIGIETLIGRIINRDKYDNQWSLKELLLMKPDTLVTIEKLKSDLTTVRTQVSVKKIVELILENNWIVAASGAIFRTDKSSVVCDVLTDWFNKRVEYKGLMKEAFKVKKDPELGEFYNRRQHAYKIKLNDVYGCYAINGWRYTDGHKMISSAITLTGQRVTQESIKFVNKFLNEYLDTKDKDYVVTSDTDSLFIQVKDLLIHKGVDLSNKEECISAVLELTSVIQKAANEFIGNFAKEAFHIPEDRNHYFELKQEVVIERGYFSGKRRYAMLIVNKEGVPVEEMVMMGLDLMKSNMPPLYKKFGSNLIQDILLGKHKKEIDKNIIDFKTSLNKLHWSDLAKPTGVKQINNYISKKPTIGEIFSELKTKCPINTKAAIYYNDILRFKRLDKTYPCFVEGDKMKYVALKPNPFEIDVMGFNGSDPEFITEFIDNYVDREEAFNSVLINKLKGIYEDIGWGDNFPVLDSKINKFFRFN
jgi:DNA polymerase elongation subunit (family B)